MCNKRLTIDKFGRNKSRKDGLQSRCKICDCRYKKQKYLENCEVYKERARKRRARLTAWFEEFKQTLHCQKCEDQRWYVLDFHHRDVNKKERSVSYMVKNGFSKDKILDEMKKCDVLCSNCHREFHHLNREE